MIFSAPVIALGATLGTALGILAICGLSLLCKSCKKGISEKDQELDLEKTQPSVFHSAQQFSVKKSTEPIQPRTLLKFPRIYRPKPLVTSPEVINSTDYTLETTDEPSAENTAEPDDSCLATDGSEEVFIIPRQDSKAAFAISGDLKKETAGGNTTPNPKLHFSLRYDTQTLELHVTVIEAENVSATQGHDCYITGHLTTKSGKREALTSIRRVTPHLLWEETLVFPLPEGYGIEGEISLSLFNCDKFSRHTSTGVMRFKLADVGMLPPKQDPAISVGEILLSISYLPAANRLGVVVMKARSLQSDKLKDVIDLSVKLALKHQATKLKKKQTRRVKHKMNPVWNEMMMFEVPHKLLSQSSLDLEVLNQACVGDVQSLGRCAVGMQSTGTGLQHWQQMLNNPRKQLAMWHPLYE
ncbi:Synaptotagmin-13 [Acipenser ruthenus]|uniref:Synaptotagmin-13 n=1 Tax=Acipenser ruthenus TaxID=7906 RepID=A0A444UH04_ACIRT|nr:Synaptotagmin-13 [Acipenser ruthenus]